MNRDVGANINYLVSHVPAVLTSSTNGTVVDTKGYDNAELVVTVGDLDLASGNETYAVKVQEGAVSDGSDAADISGATVSMVADNTTKTIRISSLGTGTRKRYMRAVLTVGGTTPSCPLTTVFVLGGKYYAPKTPDASV